ncbi:hypothetical protein I6A84_26735 [Frankia sp. CNm7]|uniref:Uncharacterized protein n=1 Tax=Frankia nepalensis TaxID=1836974 RepID=A0A937RDV2_9ACTN|nr:hypothetical protein [Frankia nepalensis]MBL7501316.1 hypothetical protein [Frankia nepalensis]MBL7510834.1 hypothetical protein [Frankia nepalensis]MBL7521578.1 hypothetical protein [Frankia nepalensis]MBL7628610.1 hypothetical protein [Frankia nepalensis]
MPKNFGLGVSVRTHPRGAGRSLVRLARRDLWQRLDRSMTFRGRAVDPTSPKAEG